MGEGGRGREGRPPAYIDFDKLKPVFQKTSQDSAALPSILSKVCLWMAIYI